MRPELPQEVKGEKQGGACQIRCHGSHLVHSVQALLSHREGEADGQDKKRTSSIVSAVERSRLPEGCKDTTRGRGGVKDWAPALSQ